MLIFIPGAVPSSKNGRTFNIEKRHSFASAATTKWRKNTAWYWSILRKEFVQQCIGKEKPLLIGMHFVRGSKHTWDFNNPCQTVQDEMVKNGWINDDNVENMFPLPLKVDDKLWSYDKENPGVYIRVLSSLEELTYNFKKP